MKIFGLRTAGYVRGSVQLLRVEDAHQLLHESVWRKQELLYAFGATNAYEENNTARIFHVNRFYNEDSERLSFD